jgi:4-amino-4-deoxy-L-arabinose transferase-like glycosyltransferase
VFAWQMVLGCATVVLVYLLARELMGETAAIVAGVLAVGYGPLVYYEMLLLREATLVFATVGLMYLAVVADRRNSWRWWAAFGVAVGLGLLLKTTLSLFFACALVVIVIRNWPNVKRAATCIGAAVAGVIIALSPAIVRNVRVGVGEMELSSVGTITFVNSNAADPENHQFGFSLGSPAQTPRIMSESDGKFGRAIWLTIKSYPNAGAMARVIGMKVGWLCNWYENPDNSNFYFYREFVPVLKWLPIGFLLVGALSVVGIVVGLKDMSRWWPVYAMAITNVAVMLAFYVNSRMRIALVPELILFAALSVSAIVRWVGDRRWMPVAGAAVAIVVAALAIDRPIPTDRSIIRGDDYLVAYMNYTLPEMKKAQANGDLERAACFVEDYLAHEPANLQNADSNHPADNITDRAIAEIFAAAHVREANLLGHLTANAASFHLQRARDLMAAAGKKATF